MSSRTEKIFNALKKVQKNNEKSLDFNFDIGAVPSTSHRESISNFPYKLNNNVSAEESSLNSEKLQTEEKNSKFLIDNQFHHSDISQTGTEDSCSESSYQPSSSEQDNISDFERRDEDQSKVSKKRRSKKANRTLWKRSIVKDLRLSGKTYVNRAGKEVPEKAPKAIDCSKCRFKCSTIFSEHEREVICKEYYDLADYKLQKMYLSSLMENVPVQRKKRNPIKKNRKTSRIYYLKRTTEERHRVCLKFFCATLAISHRVTEKCAESISQTGLFVGYDRRADSKAHNATSDQDKQYVKDHINSFPRIESHYCRRDTQKQYLSPELNISAMYRMYKDWCANEKNCNPVSQFVYENMFRSFVPVLAFYKPKKDQCSVCNAFESSKDKESLREEYENHKKREKESMDMKEEDKKRAAAEKGATYRAITFDLQAILPIPFSGDCQIYYKQHLNVYNFTIYDSSTRDGYCFVWDETHGSKGSSEIGTCLFKYIQNLPETVEHLSSFSDTCGGQNRNKFVTAAMLYAVNTIDHLKIVDLKFMESGHSYLEADSMHSTIERARAHKKIYNTREWCLLISTARIRPKPYLVENIKHSDFFDLQQLTNVMMYNATLNSNGEKVSWMRIKWIRLQKSKPYIVQYKYDLSSEFFFELDITEKRSRSGQKKDWKSFELNKKYKSRIPVSEKKKERSSLSTYKTNNSRRLYRFHSKHSLNIKCCKIKCA